LKAWDLSFVGGVIIGVGLGIFGQGHAPTPKDNNFLVLSNETRPKSASLKPLIGHLALMAIIF